MKTMKFSEYNKKELIDKIDKISIEKVGDFVITKYDGRVINTTKVSLRYEIFDIVKYLKDKIELIESNFNISKYSISITKGTQYLKLLSEDIDINGVRFYKSFYILNSTDKSRRLSFNMGLFSENTNLYIITGSESSLFKKHLTGVTMAADNVSLNKESFKEQIGGLESLVGHRVLFSKVKEVILGENPKDINHRKFDAFRNSTMMSKLVSNMTKEQMRVLRRPSESIDKIETGEDFYLDAFWTLLVYLRLFNREDSHTIKNESERIMKITQWAVRNSVLESLGI